MKIKKGSVMKSLPAVLAATALSLAIAGPAVAEDYPAEQVRLIVPYGPGGTTDNVARAFAIAFEKELGQTVVVENVGGASGITGTERLARAKPDGYTLGMPPNPVTSTAPHIVNTTFDTKTSFSAVSKVVEGVTPFSVRADFPADTMEEFIAYAKENPGITFGSSGIGSNGHQCGANMSSDMDLNLVHVPFSGSRDVLNSLLGGHIDAFCDPLTVQPAQAGSVKALTVMNEARWVDLPDVPTYKEATGEEPPITLYYSLLAPAGTPDNVIKKLNEITHRALADKGTKKRFHNLGLVGTPTSHEEAQNLMISDYEKAGLRMKNKKK